MEALFTSLINYLHLVKKDLSVDLREVLWNIEELGDRVTVVEDHESGRDEEVEWLHQEVPRLKEQHINVQIHAEDFENRSWRNNIRIIGVLTHAKGTDFEVYLKASSAISWVALKTWRLSWIAPTMWAPRDSKGNRLQTS
ncbi:hypothetical protein NDU88_007177 [Pleurodeles waltl]|uniref:Uncharacterized protein n=1 Tax=Pleurodeles waltl TaxID=8319 RepID=A0AAV7TZQ0_PLEWA|nr:hypothetical protein NDU88_007177 [Pleurodeles waltl]